MKRSNGHHQYNGMWTFVLASALVLLQARAQVPEMLPMNGAFAGSVNDVLVLGNGNLLVAGSDGLFSTVDGGRTFQRVYPATVNGSAVGFLSLAARGDTVFAGRSAEGATSGGLVISTDAGASWSDITHALVTPREHVSLLITSTAVFAGGSYLFRSVDHGQTWSVLSSTVARYIRGLAVAADGSLCAVTSTQILRSTDNGDSWTDVTGVLAPLSPRRISTLLSGTLIVLADDGVYRTTDQGVTWVQVSTQQGCRALVQVGPDSIIVGDTDGGFILSMDDGAQWTSALPQLTAQASVLVPLPGAGLFAGTPDGPFRTVGSISAWEKAGAGVTFGRVTSLDAVGDREVALVLDYSSVFYANDLNLWSALPDLPSGDSVSCVLRLGSAILAGTRGTSIRRLADGETVWTQVTGEIPGAAGINFISRASGATLYAGTEDGLFVSSDSGLTWSATTIAGSGRLTSVSAEVHGLLLAGSGSGEVFRSLNAGRDWVQMPVVPGASEVTTLVLLNDSIALAGTRGNGLLRSEDAGQSWSGLSSALPAMGVYSIVDMGRGLLFAGTDLGLYFTQDGGISWSTAVLGMPARPVLSVAADGRGFIFAGTDSTGVYGSVSSLYAGFTAENRWMNVGSLQDWFSSLGAEIEFGFEPSMQFGMRWPAHEPDQDLRASNALWIGTTDFIEPDGQVFQQKVIHAGPRTMGKGEFFPMYIRVARKHEPPVLTVNGLAASSPPGDGDIIDTSLIADQVIETHAKTSIGIDVHRKMIAFGQLYHDNYIIAEYTFTNTGDTDFDPLVERPGRTLTGVYFYMLSRFAINRQIRHVVNNSSGWGINTMNDARGAAGLDPAPADVRAVFAWHGFHSSANKPYDRQDIDNIGAPIFDPSLSAGYVTPADTNYRLGATQFVGLTTLHADTSPSDASDSQAQPSTTNFIGSDEDITRMTDPFDAVRMTEQYARMSEGHQPRHAWQVVPDGDFAGQSIMANIGVGAPGGWSSGMGYGPYSIGPGESVRIVVAEAADGLTRTECEWTGLELKRREISNQKKNETVMLGRDRLFGTFKRAMANAGTGYAIPQPPAPPSMVSVSGLPSGVLVSWEPPARSLPVVTGYEVYRASGGPGDVYEKIFSGNFSARSCMDTALTGSPDRYYYVVAVGDSADNDGTGLTPAGKLRSGSYYTQTYTPVTFNPPTGVSGPDGQTSLPDVYALEQNYPNPFNPTTDIRYQLPESRHVRLSVYDVLGREVIRLVDEVQPAGFFRVSWTARALPSGIYFCRMELRNDEALTFAQTMKMVLVR